jgi:hypothetical protein
MGQSESVILFLSETYISKHVSPKNKSIHFHIRPPLPPMTKFEINFFVKIPHASLERISFF